MSRKKKKPRDIVLNVPLDAGFDSGSTRITIMPVYKDPKDAKFLCIRLSDGVYDNEEWLHYSEIRDLNVYKPKIATFKYKGKTYKIDIEDAEALGLFK